MKTMPPFVPNNFFDGRRLGKSADSDPVFGGIKRAPDKGVDEPVLSIHLRLEFRRWNPKNFRDA